jgi:hypothetical protein
MILRNILVCGTILSALMSGCTTFNTYPHTARQGDTLSLAVGSPLDMTRANTTATFTSDSDGIPVDLTPDIRAIFNLYADKASEVYQPGSGTDSLVSSSGHEPWLTVVAIDLPPGLATGPGKIQFNTTAVYPAIGSHINDFPVSVEVLPGTGSADSFDYEFGVGGSSAGDLAMLEAQPRAVLGPANPSVACPCPDYAAIEIKVNMPTSFGAGLTLPFVRVVVEDMTVETGSARGVVTGLANGEDLTVIITSMEGALQFYEARFSIVLHSSLSFTGTPTVASIRYFDLAGNEVVGPVSDYSVAMK